uniref:J domain-containing protein n=1 Tax=viral metagenome TaxID=1070528 RepID=A0A6C0LAG8_9ZZZZ
MNYTKACENLNINVSEEITTEILKRQYRSLALKYHPDKNPEKDTVSKFQEIQESYEFLMKYKDFMDTDSSDEYYDDERDISENKGNYKTILLSFLKNILIPDNRNKLFYTILKQVASTCESNALEILSKVEKQNLIKIYDIIERYREVLHFTEDFVIKIKEIINEKIKDDECIILNPTVDDLFENNVYKLKVNGFTFVVPLWHNELVYDNSGNDVYVKCVPILPENIEIDDKNNIHFIYESNLQEIWTQEYLTINVGTVRFYIKRDTLKIKDEQVVIFSKQGISRINTKNIYDVTNKGDVIVTVKIKLV